MKIAVVTILVIFAIQIITIMPTFLFKAFGQTNSGPNLSSITLTDYNGNDQSGVADLAAGKIASYDYELTPTELSQLNSSFSRISVPANLYDLLLNPVNTSFGFNPFQFASVRQAINYILDRNYFIDYLLGGFGIPALSSLAGEPDTVVVANTTARYWNFSDYSLAMANQTIYNALISKGASYGPSSGGNNSWTYGGRPITIYLIQRIDDPTRDTYAGFLTSQLQDLGFTVSAVQATAAKADSLVYGGDPRNSTWDIYPEAWGAAYGYYDEGLAASLASTQGGFTPFSDGLGLSFGTYNDSTYEQSDLIQQGNQADQVALTLFEGNFSTFSQRTALMNNITNLSFTTAVRIYIATSLAAYGANPNLVSNISPQFVEDPVLNTLSYITMNSPSGTADLGVRHLEQGSLNPIGGWSDGYSVQSSAGVVLPLLYYQPATGYQYEIGFNYKIDSISPTSNSTLPSSALEYNYTTGDFTQVPNGSTSKVELDVNYAPLFQAEKWSDGEPISLADLIYQFVTFENASLSTNSSIYDGYANSDYASSFIPLVGFQVLNATSLRIYSNYYYPDLNYAALSDALLEPFLGNRLPGGSMMPWQLYQAMSNIVESGKAAWSTSAATSKSIDWLNLVSPTDVSAINSELTTLASQSYVPRQLSQLQNLTGVPMTTPGEASSGYSAISSFISKYGNAVVSDGPYVISQWQTSTTPNFAVLTKNPYFSSSIIPSALFAPATSITTTGSIPSILVLGSSFNITSLSTVIGTNQTTPAPGVNLVVQIIANSSVVSQTATVSGNEGQATINLPATLAPGTYTLIVYGSSAASALIDPYQTTITVVGVASTSSSSTNSATSQATSSNVTAVTNSSSSLTISSSSTTTHPSTSSTSASSTITSSSSESTSNNYSTLEIAAVVIVIIVIVGALAAIRRRGASRTGPPG